MNFIASWSHSSGVKIYQSHLVINKSKYCFIIRNIEENVQLQLICQQHCIKDKKKSFGNYKYNLIIRVHVHL